MEKRNYHIFPRDALWEYHNLWRRGNDLHNSILGNINSCPLKWLSNDNNSDCLFLLNENFIVLVVVIWGCLVMGIIWAIWSEKNQRIFEDLRGMEAEGVWEKVKHWASVFPIFRSIALSDIILVWKAAAAWRTPKWQIQHSSTDFGHFRQTWWMIKVFLSEHFLPFPMILSPVFSRSVYLFISFYFLNLNLVFLFNSPVSLNPQYWFYNQNPFPQVVQLLPCPSKRPRRQPSQHILPATIPLISSKKPSPHFLQEWGTISHSPNDVFLLLHSLPPKIST